MRVQGGARRFLPRQRSYGRKSAKESSQKQTKGLRPYRFAVSAAMAAILSRILTADGYDNPSVMLRMTAPFAQRSLGKTKPRFALYAKALSLSLPFLPKGRWHEVPEGISHGFIQFIEGKRVYTAQYIVGLHFPWVMYFCVHSPSESLVLRVLLVSPRFNGNRFCFIGRNAYLHRSALSPLQLPRVTYE